jgi:hypothetical protein
MRRVPCSRRRGPRQKEGAVHVKDDGDDGPLVVERPRSGYWSSCNEGLGPFTIATTTTDLESQPGVTCGMDGTDVFNYVAGAASELALYYGEGRFISHTIALMRAPPCLY